MYERAQTAIVTVACQDQGGTNIKLLKPQITKNKNRLFLSMIALIETRQVSSMNHSDRPTVSPVVNIVLF